MEIENCINPQSAIRNPQSALWPPACVRVKTEATRRQYGYYETETGRKKNIKKAQATWQGMSPRERSRAQPEGRGRAKPGTTGKGEYYHIEVRPKESSPLFARKTWAKEAAFSA